MKYFIGFIGGALTMCALQSNAGIISHVAAYEYGKHVAKQEVKRQNDSDPCAKPDQK